ncbi:MAG: ribonuclease P protein component [Bacteroidetes bacterium]|nr:ribonuclease P protein component [Bacteroidota bacterium]
MVLANYPKALRICSKADFDLLFKKGKGFTVFPIKLSYLKSDNHPSQQPFLFAATAPKRLFKRAVDRNRIKRQLKESIRKNKHLLLANTNLNSPNQTNLLLFTYIAAEKSSSEVIENATIKLINRLIQSNE